MTPKRQRGRRPPEDSGERFLRMALEGGAVGAKIVSTDSIRTGSWVRWKCHFGCGGWGQTLMCPPHSPTPAETGEMLKDYERAVLFETPKGVSPTRLAFTIEREAFLMGYYKAFGLGAGPCGLCDECALDEGCRHPKEARPCMEACGIDVFATVRNNDFAIEVVKSRDERPHYFGLALLF